MQITFDPHNVQECATIARLLGTAAQPDTPRADGMTVSDGSTPPFEPSQMTPLAEGAPQYTKGEVTLAQPDTAPAQPETDCHGMTHDDAIHSTPPSFNADGSWRAKRGQKEAYEAAVAAATAPPQPTPAPAPQGMPMPQPASAAPATPPAPIDYKTMAERFMAKLADPDGLPAEYEAIYAALSIGYDDLETNQTSIARLWHYMDAVDNGDDHDGCVRHAMSAD
jgi:hypothetical protein